MGNQLMFALDQSYPRDQGYKVSAHTVDFVVNVVSNLLPPNSQWMADAPNGIVTGLDVFVGYVMLDAWVANQDRHHQNWGAIWDGQVLRLAPTFDHGASLGRNLRDKERQERLTTRDAGRSIAHFCQRAQSAFYLQENDGRTLTTREAFIRFSGLSRASRMAAQIWLQQLSNISALMIKDVIDAVPLNRMSDISREFTFQMLCTNQEALLQINL